MKFVRWITWIWQIGFVLCGAHAIAQTTYYGPHSPVSGLIKVEVQIYDGSGETGSKIDKVEFYDTQISLKPADVFGFRGGGSFQVSPGDYPLRWRVFRNGSGWPRTVQHEQMIRVSPQTDWVRVSVHGEEIDVS